MYLSNLILNNFKNIESTNLSFSENINCFVGNNGSGKTNLLSSIYYLSTCKDYFSIHDTANILDNNDYFIIDGYINRKGTTDRVFCGVEREKGKTISLNGKEYQRISDHIGYIPLVMITPSDTMVIHNGSDERRRMINYMISQFDRTYLHTLIKYNKILENRNKVLKTMRENRKSDELTLDIYDTQLAQHGTEIYTTRKTFMNDFVEIFQRYYSKISDNNETVNLTYQSQLDQDDFYTQLKSSREIDYITGYTSKGIHKDDLEMTIDNRQLKKTASQGQQKTFIVSIKLAYYEYSVNKTGIKPLLLLDDIFDKLDAKRVGKIVEMVSKEHFGQIFITDANKIRIDNILENIETGYKIFSVSCGQVVLQHETGKNNISGRSN